MENILHERPLKVSGVGEYILYDEQTQQATRHVLSRRPDFRSQEQRDRHKAWKQVREFGRQERSCL